MSAASEVFEEFGLVCSCNDVCDCEADGKLAMADEIVRLRETIRHLACPRCLTVNPPEVHTCTPQSRYVLTDEWRVIARDGADFSVFYSVNDATAKQEDEKWPNDAPHTVRRVALVEEPTTRGDTNGR